MRGRGRSNLRQMRDAEHLAVFRNLPHFFADGIRGFATNVGIDFIEDKDGNLIFGGEDGFDGQHDSRQLTGGSDRAEGSWWLAGVRGKLEIGSVEAVAGEW